MTIGILSTIGNTPLIELRNLFQGSGVNVFAKMEQFNPGGSIKDRPALNIIANGLRSGILNRNSIIVESSSGNFGIGLAQICAYHKLRFICVVDSRTTSQNIALLRAYKAQVEIVDVPDPATGEFLPARIRRVRELLIVNRDSFWPNQYASAHNSGAHHQTMYEIATALNGDFDYLFCATSSCGTLRGCAEFKKLNNLRARITAVDAAGSVIFGGPKSPRLIPGHGASIVPGLFRDDLADEYVLVTDLDCVIGCYRLLNHEAILAGGSSGGVVTAIERSLSKIPRGSVCVAILPDRGERYLDTIYSEEWLSKHFGSISRRLAAITDNGD